MEVKKIQKNQVKKLNNNIRKSEINKKDFLELYDKSKKGNVDLYSLPTETVKMMCMLLEEEIKIKKRKIKMIKKTY